MGERTIRDRSRGVSRGVAVAATTVLLALTTQAGASGGGEAEQVSAAQAAVALGFDDPSISITGGDVVVEMIHELPAARARALVGSLGARVLGHAGDGLLEIRLPAGQVPALERAAGVLQVREPLIANAPQATPTEQDATNAVAGEELTKTNATAWHLAGYDGTGVKVGIVDHFSSSSWDAAVAAGELVPATGTFCRDTGATCDVWSSGSRHGTAVAEIVHEMAPGAELYLATALTSSDLQAAIDYFASQGVDVVTRSLTAQYDGAGNGTGPIADVIASAVANGMTWFNSVGNSAGSSGNPGSYWRGAFVDADDDGWLEFATGDELMAFDCAFVNGLRWSDWGASGRSDYNLYVFDTSSATTILAAGTANQQAGALPLEVVSYACTSSIDHFGVFRVGAGSGTAGDVLEIMTNGASTEHWQNPSSATGPAADSNSPGALAVGAIDPATATTIAVYSSRGPTNDGRIKPDLTAASCVASSTYSPSCFNGTSAAAPVAAGAAALVLDAGVAATPAQVKTYLLGAVVDRGASGPDNTYGAGELRLPSPPGTGSADLGVTQSAPTTARTGYDLKYTITVKNDGPNTATGVVASLALDQPPYAGTAPTQGSCGAMDAASRISCPLGTLASGATAKIVLTVPQIRGREVFNTASVSSATPDPVSSNDTRTILRTVTGLSCTSWGTAAADVLSGGAADEVLCGFGGPDTLQGFGGDDHLNGGNGSDRVVYSAATGGVVIDLGPLRLDVVEATGTAGTGHDTLESIEHATGSPFADTIHGSSVANNLIGGDGDDVLWGYDAADTLAGNAGNDALHGGSGLDKLNGGGGTDTCEDGADTKTSCEG